MKTKLAILDADHTLVIKSLGGMLREYFAERGKINQEDLSHLKTSIDAYQSGNMTRDEIFPILYDLQAKTIQGIHVDEYRQITRSIFKDSLDSIFHYVAEFILTLKQHKYTLVLLSGSDHFMVLCLANYFEIDHAQGAVFETKDEIFTGTYTRAPSTAENKIQFLDTIIKENNFEVSWHESIAIGDSISESLIFERVGIPLVFEPHKDVQKLAKKQKWIEVYRKNVNIILQEELTKLHQNSSNYLY